jgi:uncharacterized protein (DUF2236 family)
MARPLFDPRSVFWKVNREIACSFAAPRAVLMQIAHPLVAAGVAEHSQFRKHRLARLYRTSLAAAAITFGTRDFAIRAVQSINRKHQAVHGVLKTHAGIFPAGTPYDANDPELKLWVLSTITESTLLVYDLFVSRLSMEERARYYNDNLKVADLFGIPRSIVPPTYEDFTVYYESMLASGVICVSDEAKEISRALFAPTPSGMLLLLGSAVSIALLPPKLRDEFGFRWKLPREGWLQRVPGFCRGVRRRTPSVLCANPAATFSELFL